MLFFVQKDHMRIFLYGKCCLDFSDVTVPKLGMCVQPGWLAEACKMSFCSHPPFQFPC